MLMVLLGLRANPTTGTAEPLDSPIAPHGGCPGNMSRSQKPLILDCDEGAGQKSDRRARFNQRLRGKRR